MERLPAELLLEVISYLSAREVLVVCSVSRQLRKLGRDNELWRSLCFEKSSLHQPSLPINRASSRRPRRAPHVQAPDLQRRIAAALSTNDPDQEIDMNDDHSTLSVTETEANLCQFREETINEEAERARILANWDPTYPDEKTDWYAEYIARHAPLSMNWLQPPLSGGFIRDLIESRGLGLYSRSNEQQVIAPLNDGSVCLWDIGHQEAGSRRRGAIRARSKPGLLSVSGKKEENLTSKAKMINTGVVECVSVDSARDKVFIAVQSGLNEVDLNTLQISSHQQFPFSISALSESKKGLPLTVGTTLSLHLYDYRNPYNFVASDLQSERIDQVANFPTSPRQRNDFHRLLAGDEHREYAPLFQPGPLSILHLSPQGVPNSASGEIYVAGRFPSILVYDRRTFPKLRTTFHSGARLCGLTSLPYPFRSLEADLMRQGELSVRAVHEAKSQPGDRLIACGEYNGKGSLEIYGLSADRNNSGGSSSLSTPPFDQAAVAGAGRTSTLKNRASASRSKLLSVATHGTRIVASDADGNIRWFERDSAYVRSWNINPYTHDISSGDQGHASSSPSSLFFRHSSYGPNSGDVARKLLPISSQAPGTDDDDNSRSNSIEHDEILVWTGERIGLMSFTPTPRFGGDVSKEGGGADAWEDAAQANSSSSSSSSPSSLSAEESLKQREERIYGETMRRALERQADEVRWMQGLGMGMGRRGPRS